MPLILLAAFIAVPLIEIGVFIEVGGWLGLWPTLTVIVLTAMLGAGLLRAQGLATLARARAEADRGVLPVREVFDGLCLLLAGALLLTPGFVTDGLGFLLFVPAFRAALAAAIMARVHVAAARRASGPKPEFIDGEWEEVPEPPATRIEPPDGPSGGKPWHRP